MPRSILSSAASAATLPKRYTIRLAQTDWDRLANIESAAKARGMFIDIDAALADFLRREIARAEKKLADGAPASAPDARDSGTDAH